MIKNLFLFFAALGLFATLSRAQVSSVTGQYLQDNNILLNPGFESGIGKWVNSAGTFTADYTNFVQGKASGKIVLSSQALAFTQDSTSYVTALADGVQGLVSVYIKSEFAAKVCSRSAGSTVTTNCVDVVGNNKWSLYKVPSILGATSNGISINTNGTSVTGTIYIDESFVGVTNLAADVDASRIAGEAYFAGTTGCTWSRTSTVLGAFTADTDCPGPTIVYQNLGQWQTTDSNLPKITVNNLPSGTYKAKFILGSILSTSNQFTSFAINDGSTTCTAVTGNTLSGSTFQIIAECVFNYTSSGNRSFEIYASSNANQLSITNSSSSPPTQTVFILEYFGSSSVYAATANQNNVDVFSAKSSDAGVISDENIDWINGNCTVTGTAVYTCTFKTGLFTASPNCQCTPDYPGGSGARDCMISTLNSTTLGLTLTSAGSIATNSFKISCQKQGADFTATRLITGQFKEVVTTPNVNKPALCSAKISSTGVISNQKGGCFASCTNATTPVCTFTSNYWVSGEIPNCWFSSESGGLLSGGTTTSTNYLAEIRSAASPSTAVVGNRIYYCHGERQ